MHRQRLYNFVLKDKIRFIGLHLYSNLKSCLNSEASWGKFEKKNKLSTRMPTLACKKTQGESEKTNFFHQKHLPQLFTLLWSQRDVKNK